MGGIASRDPRQKPQKHKNGTVTHDSGIPKNTPLWVELTGDEAQIATNVQGTILGWDRGAQRLLGFSAAESLGRQISFLLPPHQQGGSRSQSNKHKAHKRVERFQSVRMRKDGTAVQVEVTQAPIQDEHGRLCGYSSIYREIGTTPAKSEEASSTKLAPRSIHVFAKEPSEASAPANTKKVLLATAAAAGTIAAVRELGLRGYEVSVLKGPYLAAAAWSKGAKRSFSVPPETEIARFLDRLLEIGASHPGQVLLPTSDETAWLYTANASLLEKHFRLYQPSVESMQRILDKKLFADAVGRAGLAVLPTWEPRTFDEVVALAKQLPYPMLIKPRTHVHRLMNDKGVVAHSASALLEQYQKFVDKERFQAADNPLHQNAELPILQQFVSVGNEGVCSVSGFIDRSGELFVTRRSTKVFQRSQPVGVGVCFEALPELPELSDAVRRLCLELKYFGMFEVEFLRFDGGWAAIDFNPRMFNQVGMDIRRGMPLPLFACLAATGNLTGLRSAVKQAQARDADPQTVFCDGFTLQAILLARTITGRISREEREHWRGWAKRNAAHTVDFAAGENDWMPGLIHALSDMYLGVKGMRRFLRSMPRLSSGAGNRRVTAKVKV